MNVNEGIQAAHVDGRGKAMMQDIAILTGAQVISEDLALRLENVGLERREENLGEGSLTATRAPLTLVGGAQGG